MAGTEQLLLTAISKVGFPIVICLILVFKFSKNLERLVNAFENHMTRLHDEIKSADYSGRQRSDAHAASLNEIKSNLASIGKNQAYIIGRLDLDKPSKTINNNVDKIETEK